jgi:hypothetical protein
MQPPTTNHKLNPSLQTFPSSVVKHGELFCLLEQDCLSHRQLSRPIAPLPALRTQNTDPLSDAH